MYDIHLQQKFQLLNPSGHLDIYKIQSWYEKEPYIQITNLKAQIHTPSFKKPRNLETATTDWSKSMDADFLASEKNVPE